MGKYPRTNAAKTESSQIKLDKIKTRNRKAQSVDKFSGVMVLYIFATILTKLLGFGREIFITSRFGYGVISDGYIVGFAIPDLVYSLLVGGAITASVTPVLSAAIENDKEEEVWEPISTFFTLIFSFFLIFTIVAQVFSHQLTSFLNPGKDIFVIDIASNVSRIIIFQTFFFIIIAIMGSILAANKVFGLQVFGDSIYNLICLLSIALLGVQTPEGPIRVAWGIVAAALAYFLYMLIFARPYLGKFRISFDIKHPLFKRIIFLAVPPIISGSVMQITVIIRQAFTDMFAGAVTSLRNAGTLHNLPYQIIINSIGPLLLPNLSGFLARGADKEASQFFSRTLRTAIFIMVPAAVFFFLAAEETVQAVYQWNPNTYTNENVLATAKLLRIFALIMVISAVTYFMNQVFYAKQKSWIALVTAATLLIFHPILYFIFLKVLNGGLAGLAWASLISDLIVLYISYRFMKRFVPEIKIMYMPQFIVKMIVAAIFAFASLYLAKTLMPYTLSKLMQLIQYAILGFITFASFFIASHFMQMPETKQWIKLVQKVWKKIRRK